MLLSLPITANAIIPATITIPQPNAWLLAMYLINCVIFYRLIVHSIRHYPCAVSYQGLAAACGRSMMHGVWLRISMQGTSLSVPLWLCMLASVHRAYRFNNRSRSVMRGGGCYGVFGAKYIFKVRMYRLVYKVAKIA